jgi:hypothetical protein
MLEEFPYHSVFTCLQSLQSVCFTQTKATFYPFLLNTNRNATSNKAVEWALAKSGRLYETIDTAKVLWWESLAQVQPTPFEITRSLARNTKPLACRPNWSEVPSCTRHSTFFKVDWSSDVRAYKLGVGRLRTLGLTVTSEGSCTYGQPSLNKIRFELQSVQTSPKDNGY